MSHHIAKLLLEHAESIADRQSAIVRALKLGMPMPEIREYLDWIDYSLNGQTPNESHSIFQNQINQPKDE